MLCAFRSARLFRRGAGWALYKVVDGRAKLTEVQVAEADPHFRAVTAGRQRGRRSHRLPEQLDCRRHAHHGAQAVELRCYSVGAIVLREAQCVRRDTLAVLFADLDVGAIVNPAVQSRQRRFVALRGEVRTRIRKDV